MVVNCSTGCPLDELGELKDELEDIAYLNVQDCKQVHKVKIDLVRIERIVKEYVRQLDVWHLDCNHCKSFPDKKAEAIRQYQEFISLVLDKISLIKNKTEGGKKCLTKEDHAA